MSTSKRGLGWVLKEGVAIQLLAKLCLDGLVMIVLADVIVPVIRCCDSGCDGGRGGWVWWWVIG